MKGNVDVQDKVDSEAKNDNIVIPQYCIQNYLILVSNNVKHFEKIEGGIGRRAGGHKDKRIAFVLRLHIEVPRRSISPFPDTVSLSHGLQYVQVYGKTSFQIETLFRPVAKLLSDVKVYHRSFLLLS